MFAALVLELVRSATGQGYFLNSGKRLLASSVDADPIQVGFQEDVFWEIE